VTAHAFKVADWSSVEKSHELKHVRRTIVLPAARRCWTIS